MRRDAKKCTFVHRVTNMLALTMLPLIVLLYISNLYSIAYTNRLLSESNHRVVKQWSSQIDENLEIIERSLSGIAFVEPEFSIMGNREKELSVHLASRVISQRLDTMMNAFPTLGGLFMYSQADAAWLELFADGAYNYSFREAVRTLIRDENGWQIQSGRWTIQEVADENMLFYCLKKNGAYMVAMVDFDRLLSVAEGDYQLCYIDEQGKCLDSGSTFEFIDTKGQLSGRTCVVEGKSHYIAVWNDMKRVPVRLVLAISNTGYWYRLTNAQIGIILLTLATTLMIPLARIWVQKHLREPLKDLSLAMERIKAGELEEMISQNYEMQELDDVRTTLNSMMSQIHTLKIEAYEKELDRQRIEMQYLHMQLRPHFFLNCLKNIYACAQRQRFQQVQEMTLAISDYIRYLFRDNMKMVTLREELQYVRNYIQIQQLSLSMPPRCEFSVDESLMDIPVPPLCVESFVENAVKHQWKPDRQLVISVHVVMLEADDGRYLDITVRDNGEGFCPEVLEQINSLPDDSFYREFHVGLTNLNHRLRLIYGGRAALAFYNDADGAVCEVICPMDEKDPEFERRIENECSGCGRSV